MILFNWVDPPEGQILAYSFLVAIRKATIIVWVFYALAFTLFVKALLRYQKVYGRAINYRPFSRYVRSYQF